MKLNATEQQAYKWLQTKGYTKITFQARRSPDFLLPDGSGFEVKKERNNIVTFTETQWEALSNHPDITILIFNDEPTPVAVVPFTELTKPPSFWKQFRLLIYNSDKNRTGKIIKLSEEVVKQLDKLRHIGQSYDGVIRELLQKQGKHEHDPRTSP